MEANELVAEKRTITGKQVKQLRRQGLVPAVVYGHSIAPVALQIAERELSRMLDQPEASRLINLRIGGAQESHAVLPKEIQRDFITGATLHIDFQEVVMTENITAEVRIVLVGESPAVADGSIVLVQRATSVQIECLPADLISVIEVDLGVLAQAGDEVHISDLKVSDRLTILNDLDEVVVQALHSRVEAEMEAIEEEAEIGEVPEEVEVPLDAYGEPLEEPLEEEAADQE